MRWAPPASAPAAIRTWNGTCRSSVRQKLPKVKELSAEYQELLAEKRKLYPEYRRAREEMRELLTVKANVDQLLNRWEKKERILDDSREK